MEAQPQLFNDAAPPTDSTAAQNIAGLTYIPDWLSVDDRLELVTRIDEQAERQWSTEFSRRVQHHGYRYDYKARTVAPDMYLGPLPIWLAQMSARLVTQGLVDHAPDQAIINEYMPGQGIAPHVDCEPCFGPQIAMASLGSHAVMEFAQPLRGERRRLFLTPGSLVVIEGEARYQWTHAIPKRKTDTVNGTRQRRERRLSITFRTVILDS